MLILKTNRVKGSISQILKRRKSTLDIFSIKVIFFKRYNLITEAICTYNFHNALTRNTLLVCTHLCSYETFFLSKKLNISILTCIVNIRKYLNEDNQKLTDVYYPYICAIFSFQKLTIIFRKKSPHFYIYFASIVTVKGARAIFLSTEYL